MAQTYHVEATNSVVVPLDAYANSATVENLGPDSLYYKAGSTVSAGSNDGTLSSGATLTITTATAFLAQTSSARLYVQDTATAPSTGTPGLYLPSNWGQFWRAKRNAAGSGLVRIALLGDSVSRGYFSSNLNTKGWVALVAAQLQALYGDGGSGWQGIVDSGVGMTALSVPAGAQTHYAGQQVGATGTWSLSGDTAGPGAAYQWSSTATSTLTLTVRGTALDLYYQLNSTAETAVPWTIDGVAQAVINMRNATTQPAVVTVAGLADTTHTVVVTVPSTNNVPVYGCVGRRATGVIMHNFSKYGAPSSNFATGALNWSGGPSFVTGPVDLLIYNLANNDAAGGGGQDAWLANAGNAVRRVREVANPQTDILFVLSHIGNADNASPQYPGISSRARGLAEASGAGLLDLWTLGRNSWAYWNSFGYWSDTSGTGASGTDNVHPGDTGHQYIANQILPLLTA